MTFDLAKLRAETLALIGGYIGTKAGAVTLRLLDEIERLTAENARCRAAVMPFDDALCDLSAMLIEAGFWPEMADEVSTDQEGTTADYQASARNVIEGASIAIAAARAALPEGDPR